MLNVPERDRQDKGYRSSVLSIRAYSFKWGLKSDLTVLNTCADCAMEYLNELGRTEIE